MKKSTVKLKDDDKVELMVVNKCPLKNIIRHDNLLKSINENVIMTNKIIVQVYQFVKLYLLKKYYDNKEFPILTQQFIMNVIKTITIRKDTRGKPPKEETIELLEELHNFYESDYKKAINKKDILDNTKMNFILAYEAIDVVKNIENNISEHFVDRINKFVNITFGLKQKLYAIDKLKITKDDKKERKKLITTELRLVKNDLLQLNTNYESDKKYHDWLNTHRKYIITKTKYDKDSIYYDVCSHTQDYLKPTFYINEQLEKINDTNISIDKKNQIKLFQVIPQRTNIIPKYITIDTCGLINMVVDKNTIKYLSDIDACKKELWEKHFKLNRTFRRKNYTFNYMIKTDGIGCSILLIKTINGEPIKITSGKQRQVSKIIKERDQYIEDVKITNEMKSKNIVTIDPNLSDLVYCLTKRDDEIITFRYTQNQRRKETRKKKYSKITNSINTETKINDKTIKEYETELSEHNSKTMNYNKFIKYCKKKNKVNSKLFKHYRKTIFRKLKLNLYINTQKSESKMIKNFEKKMGKPEDTIIVMGDYDRKNGFKGKEPTICKRIRKLFRNHKYDVYLINEFNTSKLCHKCENECDTFLERESKKPSHKGELIECWGLKCCNNIKCKLIHNRDKNSCLNMLKIVKSIFAGKGRPKKYGRTKEEVKKLHTC